MGFLDNLVLRYEIISGLVILVFVAYMLYVMDVFKKK